MAVSTSSWFNNATVGIPQIGYDFDVFETSTTSKLAIGHRHKREDGNEYVYAHFGAALSTGGLVLSTDQTESSRSHVSSLILASGSVTAIAGETINPGTIGSRFVEIISASVTADQYAGGYFQTTEGEGGLHQYRIKGNTASSAKTSGAAETYYVELYEPLVITLASAQNTWHRIIGSRYANLESVSAGVTSTGDIFLAGVTTRSHAASTYGWVQTKGVCGIRTDASNAVNQGSMLAISENKAGCANSFSNMKLQTGGHFQTQQVIGYCVASATAGTAGQLIGAVINI